MNCGLQKSIYSYQAHKIDQNGLNASAPASADPAVNGHFIDQSKSGALNHS